MSTAGGSAGARRASVLLVRGSGEATDAVSLVLRQRGFDVLEAESAADALRLASERPVDLLVTELFTATLNGVVLAARVMGSHRTAGVLYMTDLDPAEVERVVGVPLDALRRPFSTAALSERIEAALEGR